MHWCWENGGIDIESNCFILLHEPHSSRTCRGHIDSLQGLAVNPRTGLVYVAEDRFKHRCVTVFDPATGKVVRQFGGGDDSHFKLSHPRGIAIDAHGNVLVIDRLACFESPVAVFNSDGVFLAQFRTHMTDPECIHVCGDGTVIVTGYGYDGPVLNGNQNIGMQILAW